MTMGISNSSPHKSSLFPKKIYRRLIFLGCAVFLGGALTVPFFYETQTLWYKTGADKLMLRAGQMAGLLALVLLVLQVILSVRGSFLADLFGGANMMRWHRVNGVLAACAALLHVTLILAPEGLGNLPIGKKYWPEMIGGALFLLIVLTVLSSQYRSALKWDYKQWRMLHKPSGYLILVLVLLHVLFVSESFEQGVPRVVLLTVFAGLALFTAVVKSVHGNAKA
jgi:predicted ferric reductase